MVIELIIYVTIAIFSILFIAGLFALTWQISKGGIDLMQFFGNAGRPGTSRELTRAGTDEVKESGKKWSTDGKRQ